MPNWCNNTVSISHKDPAKMYALVEAINAGNFCKFAIPVPESLNIVAGCVGSDESPEQKALVEAQQRNIAEHGHKDWYDFCTSRWGTKWDVDPYEPIEYDDQHESQITFGFDSAWSPPIGVYEALVEDGYEVTAYYYESGMAYCGVWQDGCDDYYEIGGETSETVRELIGDELDEMFCISESMAEYEADNAEE